MTYNYDGASKGWSDGCAIESAWNGTASMACISPANNLRQARNGTIGRWSVGTQAKAHNRARWRVATKSRNSKATTLKKTGENLLMRRIKRHRSKLNRLKVGQAHGAAVGDVGFTRDVRICATWEPFATLLKKWRNKGDARLSTRLYGPRDRQ